MLIILFAAGIYLFMKEKQYTPEHSEHVLPSDKNRWPFPIIVLISFLVLITSFYLNYHKASLDWDAVSLFDARAKYLELGERFSQMANLTEYDILPNKPYYLLYPPFTSLVHYVWRILPIHFPVSIFYSVNLMLLGLVIFLLTRKTLGTFLAASLSLLTISSKDIFVISTLEYTNLPYTLIISLAVFLMINFLLKHSLWIYVFLVLAVVSSFWTRELEPIWAIIILSFFLAALIKKRMKHYFIYLLVMVLASIVSYLSWHYFVGKIADSPALVQYSYRNILQSIIGVFTGRLFSVVLFIGKTWNLYLLIYLPVLIIGVLKYKRLIKNTDLLFSFLFLTLTLSFYVFGLYFISFQKETWSVLGGSLVRSSTFLVPVAGYFLFSTKRLSGGA